MAAAGGESQVDSNSPQGNKSPAFKGLLEIARPKVETIEPRVVQVTEKQMTIRIGDKLVMLRRGRHDSIYISIWGLDGKGEPALIARGRVESPEDITRLDLDDELIDALTRIVEQWDVYHEREIARILLTSKIDVVPKSVSDREALAEAISNVILDRMIVKTFTSNGRTLGIYCYEAEKGVYEECETRLGSIIEDIVRQYPMLRTKTVSWVVKEVLKKIERRTQSEWRPARHKLVFRDKVFDWDIFIATGDLEQALSEPSPEIVVQHWIPWRINVERWRQARTGLARYIPPRSIDDLIEVFKTLAPKSYKAFLAWVKRPEETEEEAKPRVALLLEIIGYTLYPHDYPFHKAVLLVGEGSNGKSTYLKLLATILGEHNVASVGLRDLDPRYNRFAAAELYGKLANISSEPVKGGVMDATLFKQLTGEDLMRFERKFRDPFYGRNYAKMVFAANELPRVNEDTYAFWRRWIVVEFPNRFPPNPGFFEKTFTQDEIEGIILAALHAFRLVMLRGGFTEQGAKDPKEEWLRRSSPVYAVMKYLEEQGIIEFDREGWIAKDDLYLLYVNAAKKLEEETGEEIETVPKKKFTEELQKLFGITRRQVKYGGRKYNSYAGVKIKDWEKAEKLAGNLSTPRPSNTQLLLNS